MDAAKAGGYLANRNSGNISKDQIAGDFMLLCSNRRSRGIYVVHRMVYVRSRLGPWLTRRYAADIR